jgi:hypothetical protein
VPAEGLVADHRRHPPSDPTRYDADFVPNAQHNPAAQKQEKFHRR